MGMAVAVGEAGSTWACMAVAVGEAGSTWACMAVAVGEGLGFGAVATWRRVLAAPLNPKP